MVDGPPLHTTADRRGIPVCRQAGKISPNFAKVGFFLSAFDSSTNRDPLQFTIDEGQIIPGFEQGIVGMNPSESKTTKVPADKAYVPHRKEMVLVVDRNQFPVDLKPKIGQQLQSRQADGGTMRVTVTDVSESSVTLDANHPLAGKDITFDIRLVEIV